MFLEVYRFSIAHRIVQYIVTISQTLTEQFQFEIRMNQIRMAFFTCTNPRAL